MGVNHHKDEKLLNEIKQGNQRIVKELFKEHQASFILFFVKKNVDKSTALDIYTKAFTIFYFNTIEGKLNPPLESSIKTYLHGIGINLLKQIWSSSQKKKEDDMDLDVAMELTTDFREDGLFDYYYHEANKNLVRKILQSMDDKCRRILEMSFIKGYSDNAIMHEFDFSNENAVRQQKFRCLNKAKKLISK